MINFFVLYVVPLLFMSFVYVRISITLWRSSTIQSLPLISLHLLQHEDRHHQQQQQQRRESGSNKYLPRSSSHSSSSARPFMSTSYPNSPASSARSSLRSHCKRSQLHGLNIETATPAAAAEHQLSANDLAPPVATTTTRRPTASNARAIHERRSTQFNADHNPLTSRRKVVRLLAAVVISFALCMLPHHVRIQLQEWGSASYSYEEMYIPPITTLVFYINSCLNPLLYALISDKFRQAFADLRCCRNSGTAPPPPVSVAPAPAHRHVLRCNSQPHFSQRTGF